jgi:hypothetical protein
VPQSEFGGKLIQDLLLRNQFDDADNSSTNLLLLQAKLILLMRHEGRMKKIKFDLDHGNSISQSDAAFLVIDLLPCSMHGEVRNTTKFVTLLLSSALARCVVFATGSKAAAIDEVKLRVTTAMSFNILGSHCKPPHWKFPWCFKTNTLGRISFNHDTTNKLMSKINVLIDACLQHPSGKPMTLEREKELWYLSMAEYNQATIFLNKKTNLEREEVYKFQFHVDQFAKFSVRDLTTSNKGINNYHLPSQQHQKYEELTAMNEEVDSDDEDKPKYPIIREV